MRAWLDAILAFIGTTSLTDVEYDSINFVNLVTNTYNQAAYDELSKVLISRDAVSTLQQKLIAFFGAKGVTVTPAQTGNSKIYLGSVL